MHIHILGIGGKLMSGIAVMAHQLGHTVTGNDGNIHSPMIAQLHLLDIAVSEGYDPQHLEPKPDLVIVGNVMSRGNPLIEAMLNRGIAYCSAPEWLAREVLHHKWVIAISGTHGKTTTASMIAWILQHAGFEPSYIIGGQPNNFEQSSRLNLKSPFFVIEADEYDSAFFDKRPKFIHYHPNTLVMNNLEFDHADIYDSLAEIQKQFHYLLRTVPGEGLVICPSADHNLAEVLERGVWTPVQQFGESGDWTLDVLAEDYSSFAIQFRGKKVGEIRWRLLGQHNAMNALAAVAAAHHAGMLPEQAVHALCEFAGVERRLQPLGELFGAKVYDDFAHHPTAIKTTLSGLRSNIGKDHRIIVILEFGSSTMRSGEMREQFSDSLRDADYVFLLHQNCKWDVAEVTGTLNIGHEVFEHLDGLQTHVQQQIQPGDRVVIMTNQDSRAISQAIGVQS